MAEEKSKVEELSESLYSRTRYHDPRDVRSPVKRLDIPAVEESWQTPGLDEMLTHERKAPEITPFMKKFFVFALLFFIATILVAGFVFLGGTNFISSKNVDIEVVGPTAASAGEVLELGVTISNKNNTDLETASFSVQYPQGSRDPADSSKTLTYTREDIGVVKAGDEVPRNVRLIVLGATGEVKEIKLSVEYKVKGSNATFYKDKIYQITIGDSPLSLSIESPEKVTSGEIFTTTLNVTLNSTEILRNVALRGEYPYGYSVVSSEPDAIAEDNVWALGDLSPGSSKKIVLRGRLVGENRDERTFRFYVGVSDNGSISPNFKTVILSGQETVAIERPSVGLSVSFNGENLQTYIAPAAQPVSGSIRFQNNLPEKLLNPRLEVRLSGAALNQNSVIPQNGGAFNVSNSRINWNIANALGLPELSPGEAGSVSFSFASLPETLVGNNPEIDLQFILTGTPVGTSQPITISETRTVKIASQVSLSSRAVRSLGSFVNTGPIPPKVGQETTYSVIWSVGNTQSDINDAKVTARLGSQVKWVGSKSVEIEEVSYDDKTNTVTWNLGRLASGTGFSSPLREIVFQIVLIPTNAQVGSTPTLVSAIMFSGTETLRSQQVSVSSPNLTTRLSSDPAFIQGDDVVQK